MMDSLHPLLLLFLLVGLVLGFVRFDLLLARWRELTAPAPDVRAAPRGTPHVAHAGMQPHDAPVRKPAIHRSGRRH